MDPATSQMILEFIPQGGFAAFLLWQYIQQKKDLNASREEQKQDLDDTYIEWCMRYANTPKKYTPRYESWWNKKYGKNG